MKQNKAIEQNIKVHDNTYREYENKHGEIYNPTEQQRLHDQLEQAIQLIETSSIPKKALDFGCGSGNLTKHLIDLGLHVTASDVSKKFLTLIQERYNHTNKLEILNLNGQDLSNIENNQFDFIATYSVLHHIPDYLRIIEEFVRVIKSGGIIYLDHENNASFWNQSKEYEEFIKLVKEYKDWRRFFKLSKYINRFKKIVNPKFQAEGDIHVWPDDHIEWDEIENILINSGCEIIIKDDYLLFKKGYSEKIYKDYKDRCNDMRVLVARKK